MKKPTKAIISILLSAAMLCTGVQSALITGRHYEVYADAGQTETKSVDTLQDAVTVTKPADFLSALNQPKANIIVDGILTISNGADATGKMYPVTIRTFTICLCRWF